MSETSPANVIETVRDLEARQDDVLQRLDALNRQIEQVLAETRPRAATPPAAPDQLNPSAPSAVSPVRSSPPTNSPPGEPSHYAPLMAPSRRRGSAAY